MVYTKRSTTTTKKYAKRPADKVSAATKKYVKRVLPKVETKQVWAHHNEVQLNTLSQGYQSTAVCQIGQGTAANNRIGNIVHLSSLDLRGALNNNSTSESFVRMVVLMYPGTNGDPTLNIFRSLPTGTTAGVSTINGLDEMYYPINTLEFTVLYDKVFRLAGSATGNSGSNTLFFKKNINLKQKRLQFKSTGSGVGNQDYMYSVIWIAADANDDTSTGTAVELSCLERLFFKDA